MFFSISKYFSLLSGGGKVNIIPTKDIIAHINDRVRSISGTLNATSFGYSLVISLGSI